MSSGRKGTDIPLSSLIKQIRESHHISQERFAQIIGASRPSVQNYEAGKTKPKAVFLSRILRLAPPDLVEPTRKYLIPDAANLIASVEQEARDAEAQFNKEKIRLLEHKVSRRYSDEARSQLHDGLDLILDLADSTAVDDISARITRIAGQLADPNRPRSKRK